MSRRSSTRRPHRRSVAAPRRLNRERVVWAALFVLAASAAAYLSLRPAAAPEPLRRLSVAIPEGASVGHLALSPDGRRLALTLSAAQGGRSDVAAIARHA